MAGQGRSADYQEGNSGRDADYDQPRGSSEYRQERGGSGTFKDGNDGGRQDLNRHIFVYHIKNMTIADSSDRLPQNILRAQCKAARALLAWNQQELAQRAQIGVSTVADFERGKRTPTEENIDAMIAAFAAAGLSFANAGVQGPGPVSSASPASSSSTTTRLIEATDLQLWSARNDAKQY